MNKYKAEAEKAKKQIEELLKFKNNSKIYIDNDFNKGHCYNNDCPYVKNNSKQPCTCYDGSYIRLVELNLQNKKVDIYRLYYQLGHEMGHQWFGVTKDNDNRDETLACYTALLVLKQLLKNNWYFEKCVKSKNYEIYKQNALRIIDKIGYSTDKKLVEETYQTIIMEVK